MVVAASGQGGPSGDQPGDDSGYSDAFLQALAEVEEEEKST